MSPYCLLLWQQINPCRVLTARVSVATITGMTIAVDWPLTAARSKVRRMPRPATGETFIARVRIPLKDWRDLEKAVGEKARARWIREFVQSVVKQAGLWMDARRVAELRGESLWEVIEAALKRYVARNRALLGDEEDE